MSTTLVDEQARERAGNAIEETVVVAAGAGSGKTTVLVKRVVSLVEAGADIRSIAAVTFTEAAASDLREAVRAKLGKLAATSPRARVALADLDAAAMGTLHSFAHRILAEHPIAAGLPPVVEVLPEVSAQERMSRWWQGVRTELLSDPDLAEAVQILQTLGLRPGPGRSSWDITLHTLAMALQDNWDLATDAPWDSPRIPAEVPRIAEVIRELQHLQRQSAEEALSDKIRSAIDNHLAWADDLAGVGDHLTRLEWLDSHPVPKAGNVGGRAAAEIRARLKELREEDLLAEVKQAALQQVMAYLARAVLQAAEHRQRDGQLIYHDLLVLTRDLLRRDASVRQDLHDRYRYLLLDEFQDTDPIQVEIAVRIAAGAAGSAPDWRDCAVPAGSIFAVGDPKQSIYRFRRADITTFMEAVDHLAVPDQLTTNFRSHGHILRWVNHVFSDLIRAVPGSQPDYVPLDPSPLLDHSDDRARVHLLRYSSTADEDVTPGEAAKASEAALVADHIATALSEEWPIRDGRLTPRDVTVLVPGRSSLPHLEAALKGSGVPYRLQARSLIYGSPEIEDLLLIATAADDPDDTLSVVAALRTPALGCGDDDLWRWRAAGGVFRLSSEPPDGATDSPVGRALAVMRDLHRARRTLTPSELLSRIISRARLLPSGAAYGQQAEVWRRYRFVVDQARAWSETEHGSLRDYLHWARSQRDEEDRSGEVVLDEHDSAAVSVMTIHAAKGLQFPMVVLAGMTSKPALKPPALLWDDSGRPQMAAKNITTSGWKELADLENERLDHEQRRLLYVATTRAMDYLTVSAAVEGDTAGNRPARGQLLAAAAVGAGHIDWAPREQSFLLAKPASRSDPLGWEVWKEQHDSAIRHAAARQAVSAGAIAHGDVSVPVGLDLPEATAPEGELPGLRKDPRDLEEPSWMKGRYGTAVGQAVHGTLQTLDLAALDPGSGLSAGQRADIDGAAAAQALAEGVADQADLVAALARSALGSSIIAEAAGRDHQVETYVATMIDGQVVEGFVDLLFTDTDGAIVVVDYKSDQAPGTEMIAAYQRQLAIYGKALADATGRPVSRRVLVFCRPDGPAAEVQV